MDRNDRQPEAAAGAVREVAVDDQDLRVEEGKRVFDRLGGIGIAHDSLGVEPRESQVLDAAADAFLGVLARRIDVGEPVAQA